MTIYNVANASELTAALSSAGSGDTINLADGSYGTYTISGKTGIRIQGNLGAVFTRLTVNVCSDCVFHGFKIMDKSNASQTTALSAIWAVPVNKTVQFINLHIEGADPVDVTGTTSPAYVSERLSDNLMLTSYVGLDIGTSSASFPERRNDGTVIVAGCRFKHTTKSINAFGSEDVICYGNWFETCGRDAFSHGGCNDVLFQENYGPYTRYSGSENGNYWHKDFCQGQAGSGRAIVCRGNFQPMQDNQITSQGLFHDDGSWTYGYSEQNIIMGGNLRGIEMPAEHFGNSWAYDNTVFRAVSWGAAKTHIVNAITSAGNMVGHNTNNDGASGSNYVMQYDAPSDPNYYSDFYTNILGSGNIYPVDVRPVTGSLADPEETTNYGAGNRILQILDGTPFTYRTLPFSFGPSVSDVDSAYVSLGNPYAAGWTWPVSTATPSAPVISGLPTISGTTNVGSVLTATAASVTGYPVPARSWQWYNSVSGAISGATSATYTLQASDEGDTVYVIQTETNSEGADTAQSANSATIGAALSAPTISTLSPANGATGVSTASQLVATFDQNIQFGSGEIHLWRAGAIRETWDVTADQGTGPHTVSISGNVLTISTQNDMRFDATYSVRIDAGAIESLSGASFAGIADDVTWTYSTSATAALPNISTLTISVNG